MRFPEKRRLIMKRSMALGHCVCNPKQPCPCDTLKEQDLCPCAGERPDPPKEAIRLTKHVRKAGCASKIGRADLKRILSGLPSWDDPNVLVGVPAGDDAGIYRLDGPDNLVLTVDVFSPVVDDPYTFGQVCAANSVSDIYAMGARPICALSIIGFPIEALPGEVMQDILRGGIDKMKEAGVSVIGGHSINDEEIKGGFAVTGLVSGGITNSGAQAGDKLILTKPLGTGLISFASQIGLASDEAVQLVARSMAALNKDASELMLLHGAHACTDVTGFGLAGHLSGMALSSGVTAHVDLRRVPVFAEALGCVRREILPGAAERNLESFSEFIEFSGDSDPMLPYLLYDAQTSGGLLIAMPPDEAESYLESLTGLGHQAAIIGEIQEKQNALIHVLLGSPEVLAGQYREPDPAKAELPAAAGGAQSACCEEVSACCEEAAGCCEEENVTPENMNPSSINPSEKETSMDTNAPRAAQAFREMMQAGAEPGLIDARTKRLLAVAFSLSQRCGPCLLSHMKNALKEGISMQELDEIAWQGASFMGCTGQMFYLEVKKKLNG